MSASRFPTLAPSAGHYESWFVKAHHPTEPRAFWLRHTVHQRPGEPQTASLWLTLFDARVGEPVVAGKQTFPGARVPGPGGHIQVGDPTPRPGRAEGAALTPGRAEGALRSPTLDADWDFTFTGDAAPQRHLPMDWMYRAKLPRTKTETPYPGVRFAGRMAGWDLDGWTGLVSHNWGSEHAERWIWTHAPVGDGWLELVLGRVRVGRVLTPWLINGALDLGGERHRLGGLRPGRAAHVEERPTGATLAVAGDGIRIEADIEAPPERFVCWRYADPAGPEHHSAHTSLADLHLTVRRTGHPDVIVDAPMTASYELGMRETDHGLPVQPYADGEASEHRSETAKPPAMHDDDGRP